LQLVLKRIRVNCHDAFCSLQASLASATAELEEMSGMLADK
jgi:hypothetical protein